MLAVLAAWENHPEVHWVEHRHVKNILDIEETSQWGTVVLAKLTS